MSTKFSIIIYVAYLIKCFTCDTKVWLHNTDLSLPINRLNDTHNCDGLVFDKRNTGNIFIKNLEVKRIVLPKFGEIKLMGDSVIKLGVDDNDMNCVHLKPIEMAYWHSTQAWSNLDSPYSSATPLSEKLPCWYDDVEFPHGINSSIDTIISFTIIAVNRVKFDSKYINSQQALQQRMFGEGFKQNHLHILNKEGCTDPTGCVCHLGNMCDLLYTMSYEEGMPIQCKDPIIPIGNCYPMCGSVIKIKSLEKGFTIKKIKDALKSYESDSFVSKVPENDNTVIQIIMSEEQFSGQSLLDGKMFYDVLTNDASFFAREVEILLSGSPTTTLSTQVHNTLSIVFGSLLMALLLIGLLLLFSTKKLDIFSFRIINVPTRPTFMFARYEHMPDRGDSDSMAGSIISLNRSFDNPMYEEPAPIRSISNETIATKIEDTDEDSELAEDQQAKLEPVEEDIESEVGIVQTVSDEQKYDDVLLLKDL